jgi:hypothetical protein
MRKYVFDEKIGCNAYRSLHLPVMISEIKSYHEKGFTFNMNTETSRISVIMPSPIHFNTETKSSYLFISCKDTNPPESKLKSSHSTSRLWASEGGMGLYLYFTYNYIWKFNLKFTLYTLIQRRNRHTYSFHAKIPIRQKVNCTYLHCQTRLEYIKKWQHSAKRLQNQFRGSIKPYSIKHL